MAIQINKKLAKSISYGGSRPLSSVKYTVIHYTGNDGDTAKGNCNYFADGNTRAAGAHFFVSQNGEIWMSIEMTRVAWAVGGSKYSNCGSTGGGSYYGSCTNYNSVSIELCDNESKDPSDKQIKAVKQLVAYIQSKCPNAKTIIRHFDVTGKECPARMAPTSSADKASKNAKWNNFKKKITGGKVEISTSTPAPKTNKTAKYKNNATSLNIRKGAGTDYDIIGSLKQGAEVTINTAFVNGWGYIPSKKGWVKMSYMSKVPTPKKVSYKVKTTVANLNVRNGGSTSYAVLKVLKKKGTTLSIEKELNGWGKIKDSGWVNLSYTKKI